MQGYDSSVARRYAERYRGPLKEYFASQEDRFVLNQEFRGQTVLDIGSGPGRYAQALANAGVAQLVCCDISVEMLRGDAATAIPGISRVATDANCLSVASNSVDIVLAIGLFEGMTTLQPCLAEMRRVLRRGGTITLTCWNANRWYRLGWLDGRRAASVSFHIGDIERELQFAGFSVVESHSYLWLPRRLFWIGYRAASMTAFRWVYVHACNIFARIIEAVPGASGRGWALAITAEKR